MPDELHRIVCFFAPKVALATQQYTVLSGQLPEARVKLFYGDMTDIDNWRGEKWTEELETADVIVSTPQVFLDVLRHGFWPMRRVSLLVFDEAHHSTKRNPYNLSECSALSHVLMLTTVSKSWRSTTSTLCSPNDLESSA